MRYKSFGIIELIVAMGIFSITVTVGVGLVLFSYSSNRRAQEETAAVLYAREGIEAVRSIKKRDWIVLENGVYGLRQNLGLWELYGTSDLNGKYTREIIITSAQRNSSGSIVNSGGIEDPYTKKITVNVTWNYSASDNRTLSSTAYISNWEKAIDEGSDGMLIYADFSGSDDVIRYKMYRRDEGWSGQQPAPDIDVPANRDTRRVELYAAPTRDEYVLMTKHTEDGQFLYSRVWQEGNWGNTKQLTGYGDNTNPETRNFDGAYTSNGNFVIVYDDFTYTPKYHVWNGTDWTGTQGSTHSVGGYPVWLTLRNSYGTNNLMLIVKDYSLGVTAMYWNGSSWGSGYSLASLSTSSSRELADYEWSISNPEFGGAIFNNFLFDSSPNIRIWRDTDSWGSTANGSTTGNALISNITSSPNTPEFLGCTKDSSNDITCMKSNFSGSVSNPSNNRITTNTDSGTQLTFDLAYEKSGNRALVVYSNGSSDADRAIPKFRTYNPSTNAFSSENSISALGSSLETVRLIPDPQSDDIMVVMADTSQRVYTILWDGDNNNFYSSGYRALTQHGIYGSEDIDMWFDYEWRIYND